MYCFFMFVVEMVGYGFELYLEKLVDIEEMGVYFVIRIIYIVKEIILNIFKCYILVLLEVFGFLLWI